MHKVQIRKPHVREKRVSIDFKDEETLTQQHHKDEVDINNILRKFQKHGAIEHRNEYRGQYGFATSTTLQEAMDTVIRAETMFNDLPADVRSKFNQDAGQFLDFVQNPENAKELVKMGLATDINDIATKTPQIEPQVLRDALKEALYEEVSKET
jgi:phage internal scaffolding protein